MKTDVRGAIADAWRQSKTPSMARDIAEYERRQTGIRPYSEREMADAIEMRRRWNPHRKSILTAFEASQISPSSQFVPFGMNRFQVDIDFSLAAWNGVAEHRAIVIGSNGSGVIEHSVYLVATGTAWASAGNLGTLDFGVSGAQTHFFAANTLPRGPWVIPQAGATQFGYGVSGALGAGGSPRFDRIGVNVSASNLYNIGYRINVEAFTAGTASIIMFWRAVTGTVIVTAGTGSTPI